jgi:SagB-type dehydrogenase family enzyme
MREFTGEKLSIDIISKLLFYSCGVTCRVRPPELGGKELCLRATPSAGALYPLEAYFVSWNMDGLEPGLYHYRVYTHSLELLAPGDFAECVSDFMLIDALAKQSAGCFFVSAMFQRTMLKYDERGYRFALLEAGHLAKNICLMACKLGIGLLPIGGFLDDEVNRFLSVDGVNEAAVYAIAVGATPQRATAPG